MGLLAWPPFGGAATWLALLLHLPVFGLVMLLWLAAPAPPAGRAARPAQRMRHTQPDGAGAASTAAV